MKAFLVNTVVNVVFLAILLASAGRLDYWPAWIYFAIGMLTNALMRLVLNADPALAAERMRPGPGAVTWDKRLLGLGSFATLAMLVVAGLDSGRHHWPPRLPLACTIAGALLALAGLALFLAAMRENHFFSAVIRVQRDRGHAVCRTGPYAIVRHPGNAGMILGTLAFPLLFRSAWSAIPALVSVALMLARTNCEDAFLAAELAGYRDYQETTRYRLVPGIW